jgi:hypothetical protein
MLGGLKCKTFVGWAQRPARVPRVPLRSMSSQAHPGHRAAGGPRNPRCAAGEREPQAAASQPGAEELQRALKLAIQSEDYVEAARLKAALDDVLLQDPLVVLQRQLQAAVDEERYQVHTGRGPGEAATSGAVGSVGGRRCSCCIAGMHAARIVPCIGVVRRRVPCIGVLHRRPRAVYCCSASCMAAAWEGPGCAPALTRPSGRKAARGGGRAGPQFRSAADPSLPVGPPAAPPQDAARLRDQLRELQEKLQPPKPEVADVPPTSSDAVTSGVRVRVQRWGLRAAPGADAA